MVNNFMFNAPTQVHFGKDTVDKVSDLLKNFGCNKVLLHYGGGSAVKSGLIERVEKNLENAGIPFVKLGGVVPNPEISLVYEGIELCKKENVDFILAVGGGSVIDSSKAIAYGVPYEGDAWDFWEKKSVVSKALPVGVILTIAAAGSEMSNSCVITNAQEGKKRGVGTEFGRVKFAIMDPTLTMTLPDYQSMSGCTDIIMHTFERYFTSKGNMEITDSLAEGLIKTVIKNSKIIHKDPGNYEARAEIMWAGSLSHNGLTGCGNGGDDFVTHGLEHEISGMFGVTHGAGLAAIWGSWARYVCKDIPDRFVKYAINVMGISNEGSDEEIIEKGISAMEEYFASIGMPTSIRGLNIDPSEEEIKKLASNYSIAQNGGKGSAKFIGEKEAYEIYKAAL